MRRSTWIVTVGIVLLAPAVFAGTPQDVNFAETVYMSGLSQITGLAGLVA